MQVAISSCSSSAPGSFSERLTISDGWTSASILQNFVLFEMNPQLNRYDEQRSDLLYQQMLDRLGDHRRRSRRRAVQPRAAVGQREHDKHLRPGQDLHAGAAARRHQPPGRVAELLPDDGHAIAPRARLHRRARTTPRRPRWWSSTMPPRGKMLSESESDRSAIWHERGNQQSDGDRRRAARR